MMFQLIILGFKKKRETLSNTLRPRIYVCQTYETQTRIFHECAHEITIPNSSQMI